MASGCTQPPKEESHAPLPPCTPCPPRLGKAKRFIGGAGYRSPYLSHAKRALYHLSYTPIDELLAVQIRHALNARPAQLANRGCELLSWLGRLGAGEIAVHAGWTRNTAPPSEPERLACAAMSGADTVD